MLERHLCSFKFIRNDGSLIFESWKFNPYPLMVHDEDAMERLFFPEDYGFQKQEGIICDDWVTKNDIADFIDTLIMIYSPFQRKKYPEKFIQNRPIIDGNQLMSTILICSMLGLPTELDVHHDGTCCSERLENISLEKGIVVPYLYLNETMILKAKQMTEVPHIRNYPMHLVGLYCLNREEPKNPEFLNPPIMTLCLICTAWESLMGSTHEKVDKYKRYLLDAFEEISIFSEYGYQDDMDECIKELSQLTGFKLSNPIPRTLAHIRMSFPWNFQQKYLQDSKFVRSMLKDYYLDCTHIPAGYIPWYLSISIKNAFVAYRNLYKNSNHAKHLLWSDLTLSKLIEATGCTEVISNDMLEFCKIDPNPILLLLIGIITNDNKKYIDIDDFHRIYGTSRTIEEYIQWQKSQIEEFIDFVPYKNEEEINTSLLRRVIQRM